MTNEQGEGAVGSGIAPGGIGGLAAMAISGAVPGQGGTAEDERADQLPEHENDEARGTAGSGGAGVMSSGGTAQETGQSQGAAEEMTSEDDR